MARDTIQKDPNGKVIEAVRKTPGSIYINEEHGQLRYGNNDSGVLKWVQPIPVHMVGNRVMRGQPVSIGFPREFAKESYVRSSGIPLVVPTNPKNHQVATGIAMEPGIADDTKADHVHVVTDGQIRYVKDDPRYVEDPNSYYMPPFKYYISESGSHLRVFDWDYDDVGKPVYVDGREGHVGELTMNIEEAYDGGSNICTIGRLADAPRKIPYTVELLYRSDKDKNKIGSALPSGTLIDHPDDKCVCIDIQIMGDARGLTDSTEFSVEIDDVPNSYKDSSGNPTGVVNTNAFDIIRLVKVYYAGGKVRGRIVTSDADLSFGNDGSPIGAFIAEQNVDYRNKTIVIHRLGIIRGEFNFATGDIGKELQLSMGEVSVNGGSTTYEYKMGVVLDIKRVLIDCRFIRQFKKFAPVGEIKPIYATGEIMGDITDDILKKYVEPGYIAVDKTIHPVFEPTSTSVPKAKGMLYVLVESIMYKNMAKFYRDINGTNPIDIYNDPKPAGSTTLPGSPWTANDLLLANAYFQFDDIYYKIGDGQIGSMIKYATEGSPDNLDVLWPWQTFTNYRLDGDVKGSMMGDGNFRLNITGLVNMGSIVVKDNNSYILDDFEISLIVSDPAAGTGSSQPADLQRLEGLIISPGFYTVEVEETYTQTWTAGYNSARQPPLFSTDLSLFPPGVAFRTVTEKRTKYCGYEWKIVQEPAAIGNTYWLVMVTNPSLTTDYAAPGYVHEADVYGVCIPPGQPLRDKPMSGGAPRWDRILNVSVVVRRRPTEYNDLSLNQLYFNMPWNVDVWSDGTGTIGLNELRFGAKRALFDASGRVTDVDWSTAHDMKVSLSGTKVSGGEWNQDDATIGPISTSPVAIQELALGGVYDSAGTFWVPRTLEQIYKVKGDSSLTPIKLTYDFVRTSISSNALMAFKYYSPTSIQGLTKDDRRWYYDPTEALGKSPDLVGGRKALQSIYEIPIGLWNYIDDSPSQIAEGGKRISPFNTQFLDIQASFNKNKDNLDYSSLTSQRTIWTQLEIKNQKSMTFTYTPEERAVIGEDRMSAYGRALADQSIQSNIGLLTQGLSETQIRLLKLERSLYGADLEYLPGRLADNVNSWIIKHGKFFTAITEYGALRLTKKLLDLKFLIDEDRLNEQDNVSLWSWWHNVLSEVLGWVPAQAGDPSYGVLHKWVYRGDVPPFTDSKLASGLTRTATGLNIEGGNVSDIWFWIKFFLTDWESVGDNPWMIPAGSTINFDAFKGEAPSSDKTVSHFPNTAWFRADHIFFKRTFTPDVFFSTKHSGVMKYTSTEGWQLPMEVLYKTETPLAFHVFRSQGLGKSDYTSSNNETFASQSLEGIINDLSMRIALWNWQYDPTHGVMKSDISMYSIAETTNENDKMLRNEVTGVSYAFLKTSYGNTFVNFHRPPIVSTGVGNRYFDWKGPGALNNKFVSAIGMDPVGKIQVTAGLVLKGIVNTEKLTTKDPEFFDEYTNQYNASTDYDSANLIDIRHPRLRDTRLPILGVYGTRLDPFKLHNQPRKFISSFDPNYMSLLNKNGGDDINNQGTGYLQDGGYDHGNRPSIFRVQDQTAHPNFQRYILESVIDIPRERKWRGFDQKLNSENSSDEFRSSTSPNRAAFDLFLPPEYQYKTYRYEWPLPFKSKSLLENTNGALFKVLDEVPDNYIGYTGPSTPPITKSEIPIWARMKRTGTFPNFTYDAAAVSTDPAFGHTFHLNAHQIQIPKIPVIGSLEKINLPRLYTFVYPVDLGTRPQRDLDRIEYNGSTSRDSTYLGVHPKTGRTTGPKPAGDNGSVANIYEDKVILKQRMSGDPEDPNGYFYSSVVHPAVPLRSYWMYYFDFADVIESGDITRRTNKMFVAPSGLTQMPELRLPPSQAVRARFRNSSGPTLRYYNPSSIMTVTGQLSATSMTDLRTWILAAIATPAAPPPFPAALTISATVSSSTARVLGAPITSADEETDNSPRIEFEISDLLDTGVLIPTSHVKLPDTVFVDRSAAGTAGAVPNLPGLPTDPAMTTRHNLGLGDIESLKYWTIGAMATDDQERLLNHNGVPISPTVQGQAAIKTFLSNPSNLPPYPAVVGHQIPTEWRYDKIDEIHLNRVREVTYDRLSSASIRAPLEVSDIKVETVYTQEPDPSAWVEYMKAKETIDFALPDQRQTLTILKGQLSALGNFTIEYPKSTSADVGLKIVAGDLNPKKQGHLTDNNLSWNFMFDSFGTINDIFAVMFKNFGTVAGVITIKGLWDRYNSVNEYNDPVTLDDIRIRLGSGAGNTNLTGHSDLNLRSLATKAQVRLASMIAFSDPNISMTLDATILAAMFDTTKQLELHMRGMLDGTAMPEQALWIDIPNSEIYLKFIKHIDKIMKLAVHVEDYMRHPEHTDYVLNREENLAWPWDNPSQGNAVNYPVTISPVSPAWPRNLMPDLVDQQVKVYSITYEEWMLMKGIPATDYVKGYNKTVSAAVSDIGRGLRVDMFEEMYQDASLTRPYESLTIFTPGKKFWTSYSQNSFSVLP